MDSIIGQTFTDFECILIDDCSSDNSSVICDNYAKQDSRIKVIHNQQNQGSSLSRKIGLAVAIGEFVLFVDADDWIKNNTLRIVYNKAVDGDFDVVYFDLIKEDTGEKMENRPTENQEDKITLLKQLLSNQIAPFSFTRVAKRDLYHQVDFPTASYSEDSVITAQVLYYANRVSYVPIVFYHYCFNPNSISNAIEPLLMVKKNNEMYSNYTVLTNFLADKFGDLSVFEPELSNRINRVKLWTLLNKNTRDRKKLFELYPQSNKLIFNKQSILPWYHEILLYLATKNILFPLKMMDVFYKFKDNYRKNYYLCKKYIFQ
jgi:glycosyltransferase involved in cell wall biosynthesis